MFAREAAEVVAAAEEEAADRAEAAVPGAEAADRAAAPAAVAVVPAVAERAQEVEVQVVLLEPVVVAQVEALVAPAVAVPQRVAVPAAARAQQAAAMARAVVSEVQAVRLQLAVVVGRPSGAPRQAMSRIVPPWEVGPMVPAAVRWREQEQVRRRPAMEPGARLPGVWATADRKQTPWWGGTGHIPCERSTSDASSTRARPTA